MADRRREVGGGVLAVERALPPFSQFSRSGARTPHAVLARATRRYARTNNRRALDMHSLPVAALLLFTYIALFDLLYAGQRLSVLSSIYATGCSHLNQVCEVIGA